jgi:hypothetical protein
MQHFVDFLSLGDLFAFAIQYMHLLKSHNMLPSMI